MRAPSRICAHGRRRLQSPANTLPRPTRWNNSSRPNSGIPRIEFYEDLSPAADSGIRKEKRFKDPGTQLQFAGVRELIGYIPWEFYAPDAEPRHRLEAALRSQRIRRQVRAHDSRAPQPALPLCLRAINAHGTAPRGLTPPRKHCWRWPILLNGPAQTLHRPAAVLPIILKLRSVAAHQACPAAASSTGSTKISTPIPMSGSRKTCSSPRTSRSAAATITIIPDLPIRSSPGSSACARAQTAEIVIHPLLPAGDVELFRRGRPSLSRPSAGNRVRREPASNTSAGAASCCLSTARRSQAAPRSARLEANLPQ